NVSLRSRQAVADASNREQTERIASLRLDLLAEIGDVNVTRANVGDEGRLPGVLQDLPSRERPVLAREQGEDAQLGRAAPGGDTRHGDPVPEQVDLDVAGSNDLAGHRPIELAPPQDRPRPGDELAHREGLGDVVV